MAEALHKVVNNQVIFMPITVMKKKGIYEEMRIRCRYCDLKSICHLREDKEKREAEGVNTKCPFTPNRPKKKKK